MRVGCQVCSVDRVDVMSGCECVVKLALFYMEDLYVCAAIWRSVSNIGLYISVYVCVVHV
jgi:hypothetical protein